jgi:type 1 fimbria pilin
MKKLFTISAFGATALCAMLGSGAAFAQSATLTFNGALNSATCTIGVNGGTGTVVTLPTINASAISSSGTKTAGEVLFSLNLTACTGKNASAQNITVAVPYFDNTNNNINTADNNLFNGTASTNATGVELQLQDGVTKTNLSLSTPPSATTFTAGSTTSQGVTVASVNSGVAKIPLYVQYYATAVTPTAGLVTSSVPIIMQYN